MEKEIYIKDISTASIDGNTYYYFTSNDDKKYYASINVGSKVLPFVKIGDVIKVKIYNESEVTEIIEILN